MRFIKNFLLVVAFIFVIAILAAIAIPNYLRMTEKATQSQQNTTQSQQVEEQKPALELLDKKDEIEGYSHYIIGSVRNNTGKKYSYVQISFNLYDENMNQVGTAFDNINNLEPGSTWKFKALIFDDSNVKHYKLGDLTGF